MRVLDLYTQIKSFTYLPLYSRYILDHQLEEFAEEQYELAIALDLPLLKHLKQFDRQQLIEIYKASMTEYLQYLSENKGNDLTELSMIRWEANQLGVIGKFELVAEDITLLNYLRGKAFRKFIPFFTTELDVVLTLVDEVDTFLTVATTTATNTYIGILKEHITQNEKDLLEAQKIALIGSFEWDVIANTSKNSPELNRIYEIEPGTNPEKFYDCIHKDDLQRINENISRAFEQGSYEHEFRFVKGGQTKYIYSKGVVIYENNKPRKIIGTVQDITGLKQIEKELLEKTVALERSNESLQQFAQVASHDLKEPVRKISLMTDQVIRREKNVSDNTRNILQKMQKSSLRMIQMIDDIMNYSTVTQWEEKSMVDLKEIVREAMDFLEQTIEDKNAIIHVDNFPTVEVIRSQLRQLFQNLIANAIKFSKAGSPPEIFITYQWLSASQVEKEHIAVADKYLQVMVKDNGIGFDQEFSKQIFRLFTKLHNKSVYEGSGIGLAIVKRIIDHHGGVIYATSSEGEGATFTFIIPV